MRRKIKDSVIKNLECVYHCFLALSTLISFISMCSLPFFVSPDIFFTRGVGIIAFIWFLISLICFAVNEKKWLLKILRKINDKIDEEEKAQLQAKAQAEADKEKAEL